MTYTPTDEQIEKAAAGLFDEGVRRCPEQLDEKTWTELVERWPDLAHLFREDARAVLVAVGPSIAAQGWDEGAEEAWAASGEGWNYEYGPCEHPLTNPYREQEAR